MFKFLVMFAAFLSPQVAFAVTCPDKPKEEMMAAAENAFRGLNNDKMFSAPIAELTPKASPAFTYNGPSNDVWSGTLNVTDKSGETVAQLFSTVHCNNYVEFSLNWKRDQNGKVKSGIGN